MTNINPPILTNVLEYKHYLRHQMILAYTENIKNHLLKGTRNYLSTAIEMLLKGLDEIDNADFEESTPDHEHANRKPF